MTTIAYLRVSKDEQQLNNQKLAILEYAQKNKITIDNFMEIHISSRRSPLERRINELIEKLENNDTLIVSELSRLGRSTGQVIQIIDEIIKKKVDFIAIKESITIKNGIQDMYSKVLVTLFSLFAELERDLISQRTKEGLAAARAEGKLLGRPKGFTKRTLAIKKFTDEINKYLKMGIPQKSVMKIINSQIDRKLSYPTFWKILKEIKEEIKKAEKTERK